MNLISKWTGSLLPRNCHIQFYSQQVFLGLLYHMTATEHETWSQTSSSSNCCSCCVTGDSITHREKKAPPSTCMSSQMPAEVINRGRKGVCHFLLWEHSKFCSLELPTMDGCVLIMIHKARSDTFQYKALIRPNHSTHIISLLIWNHVSSIYLSHGLHYSIIRHSVNTLKLPPNVIKVLYTGFGEHEAMVLILWYNRGLCIVTWAE